MPNIHWVVRATNGAYVYPRHQWREDEDQLRRLAVWHGPSCGEEHEVIEAAYGVTLDEDSPWTVGDDLVGGWACTRRTCHTGPHVAHFQHMDGTTNVLAVWGEEPYYISPFAPRTFLMITEEL